MYAIKRRKIIIKIYFNIFPIFLKVLDQFECCRGDPYMTANRTYFASLTCNKIYVLMHKTFIKHYRETFIKIIKQIYVLCVKAGKHLKTKSKSL